MVMPGMLPLVPGREGSMSDADIRLPSGMVICAPADKEDAAGLGTVGALEGV